jgi:hypothetical protein
VLTKTWRNKRDYKGVMEKGGKELKARNGLRKGRKGVNNENRNK